jgi:hypothetical protein
MLEPSLYVPDKNPRVAGFDGSFVLRSRRVPEE